jgi:hypothetical protein
MNNQENGFTVLSFIFFCVICFVIIMVVASAYGSGQRLDRDTRRITDVSMINTALKSFYQDNGFYPQQESDGIPKGIRDYISFWPQAPTPADGSCTKDTNQYNYNYLNSGNNFSLTFCLGKTTKNIKGGLRTINPIGIK